MNARGSSRQGGYALMLLLVVLAAASLYALVGSIERNAFNPARIRDTGQALQLAREALLAYAATYPDRNAQTDAFGHLPCPDLTGDGTPTENCAAAGVTVIGLLPYKKLGLPDLRDSNGNCLWYAVSGTHKNDQPLTTLNWDTQASITVQDESGNATLAAPDDAGGGAAAVIFAVGAPLAGQTRRNAANTPCGLLTEDIAGNGHANFIFRDNILGIGNFSGSPTNVTVRAGTPGSATNHNILSWLSPRDIFTRIKARNGSGNTEFVGRLRLLSEQLANSLSSGTSLPEPAGSVISVGALRYGLPPDPNSVAGLPDLPAQQAADFARWSAHYRYARCSSGSKCINNGSCTGVLLFAGERKLADETTPRGSPRTNAERNDANLLTYFDEGNRRNLLQGGTTFASSGGGTGLSNGGIIPAGSGSSFSIANPNQIAGDDDVICLNPAAPAFNINDGVSRFRTIGGSAAQILATPTDSRLLLGIESDAALSACAWYPSALDISNGVRVYFRFVVNADDQGFTLALADAGKNPSTSMCGNSGSALGYSGKSALLAPIKPPKLALEFDTSDNNSRNDNNGNHIAFVYWAGNSPDDDKDNEHGACALPGYAPCNPTDSSGRRSLSALNDTGTTIYVRLDMKLQSVSGSNRTYKLDAYVSTSTNFREQCELNGDSYGELSSDVTICTPSLSTTLTTTMNSAWLGFTMGQKSGGDQDIVIRDFKARAR